MKKNSTGSGGILSGILFLLLGIILLIVADGTVIVTSIAIADLLFGAVLILLGVMDKIRKPKDGDNDSDYAVVCDDPPSEKRERIEDKPLTPDSDPRELELRDARKRAVITARRAQQEAKEAAERSRAAEDELIDAEIDADTLTGEAQNKAMLKVDELANATLRLSQEASTAAKRAKEATKVADEAIAVHNDYCEMLKRREAEKQAQTANNFGGSSFDSMGDGESSADSFDDDFNVPPSTQSGASRFKRY